MQLNQTSTTLCWLPIGSLLVACLLPAGCTPVATDNNGSQLVPDEYISPFNYTQFQVYLFIQMHNYQHKLISDGFSF